ncbi:PA14 domain-containing protein [Streptomyces canus]|uniref:PA14 domain-containing protein n=1 Tax=Streptomyces canus TaxID=58343 RepID=UPI002E367401|nr:PA14 domain-containing protein [Streptomyces canus]
MKSARRTTATAVVLATAGTLVTLTAAPAPAAVSCASPVFTRQFYANTSLSGTPKKTDCDTAIDQSWSGAPVSGLPKDNFGVRWTVTRDFGSGGPFALSATGLDGMRVYVDGVRKIDLWKNVSTTVAKTANVTIPSGKHTIRVDYANWTGAAKVKVTYTPRTSADVDKVKPLVPTGTSVSYDKATGKAKATWAKNKEMDLAGYRVYRRLKGTSFPATPLTTTTSTSYTDTPPPTGDTYYYEIRAYDKAGNESGGTADQPVLTADRTGPAAPSGLTAHVDLYGMVVVWNAVADAAGYELYEKDPATGSYILIKELAGTSHTYGVPETKATHTYVVRAHDAAGNTSVYSAPVTADGIDRTAPDRPEKLLAVVYGGSVDLYWDAPRDRTDGELTNGAHFTVLRSKGTTLGTDAVKVACEYPDHNTGGGEDYSTFGCQDLDWELDTAYTYGVTLTDGKGNASAVSATVTVTTADRTAPLPVTGLTATPRADGTVLRWNAPVDDDIAYYDGWIGTRRDDGTVRWLDSCFDDGAGDPLAMLCVDIPDGETLVYAVTARDKWGNSLPVTDPSVPTVSSTELDTRAAESIYADNAPLLGSGGWTWTSEDITEFDWRCEGDVCADITTYRISRWDPVTRTYGLLDTVPAVPDISRYTYLDETQPLGQVSYYRVVGVRTDGTETAAAHPYRIRPDVV